VLDRDRISAWPFPGPLALVESNVKPLEGQPTQQTHLVNHWCYLGSFDSPSAARAQLKHIDEHYFDRDAYHLLLSAFRKGRLSVFDARSGLELDNPLLGDMTRS